MREAICNLTPDFKTSLSLQTFNILNAKIGTSLTVSKVHFELINRRIINLDDKMQVIANHPLYCFGFEN